MKRRMVISFVSVILLMSSIVFAQSIRIEYDGYSDWNKSTYFDVFFDGKYDGQIAYKPEDGHFAIYTHLDTGSGSLGGFYYPNDHQLYSSKCGFKYDVGSIEDAVKKIANCAYLGHY